MNPPTIEELLNDPSKLILTNFGEGSAGVPPHEVV